MPEKGTQIDFLKETEAIRDQITAWRRDLHRFPELDLQLPQTKKYVTDVLSSLGVPYQTFEGHDGIVALLGSPNGTYARPADGGDVAPGAGRKVVAPAAGRKVAAIRGDMDGLPVREETGLPFSSENSCMHACGHDGHTAILLGIARILKEHESELPGQVKLIFQPGEENLIGAKKMVADGVLEDPHVDRLFAVHIGSLGGRSEVGDVLVNRSNVFLASECVEIRVHGKGGHAANPQLTVDPVPIAAEIITALQTLISRELKPGTVALISITALESPTIAYNVISDSVTLYGGIRSKETDTQEFLFRRAEELAQGIAAAHGGSAEFVRVYGAPAVINDGAAVNDFLASAAKLLPEEKIRVIDSVNMGADDAAYFMNEVPGCYFYFCNAVPSADGQVYPHHNSKFMIDDGMLYQAAALLLQAAWDYLDDGC